MDAYYEMFPEEYRELFKIHEETKEDTGIEVVPIDDKKRTFTVDEFLTAMFAAIENWDWEADEIGYDMLRQIVGCDRKFIRETFAHDIDEDGRIDIGRRRDVWDYIDAWASERALAERAERSN